MASKNEVKQAEQQVEAEQGRSGMSDAVHRLLLAAIGAVALAQDEMEDLIDRLVERGQIAEADGRKMLKDVMARRKATVAKASQAASTAIRAPKRAVDDVEKRIESLLGRMNVATRDEIDALGDKITTLMAKIDELKKSS